MKVTVLGLGSMGTALAGALLEAGHETTVWNRSAGKGEALAARGAARAATAAEAVGASPLVLACLSDYDAVHGVLGPLAEELRGRTLVNLTSGSPEQARASASWAAGSGIGYLDGAIMSTPPGIGSPQVMLLYSGSSQAFAEYRETLASLGDPVDLGDDAGTASLYDTALLGMMWATLGGWLQGVALTGADGVDAVTFTPVAVRWMTAVNGFMSTYAPQIDAGVYPGDDATLDVHLATIEHLVHASAARGLDPRLPELFRAFVGQAVAAGHGGDGYARLIETVRAGGRA
ncbi:NAD(P)-dependent oxidoreductase [Streptomyces hiroshimensis]|uniref:3-hydroxyisobutyrate dehydrogenase n=1 Tax=Streptomyces hiroshimensis TaxID=66424 RepID=A0ABQ2YFP0_9ACTN|nr:NAD(P)-binding domain-containing protein [Streptomyces hiroshimensis]GGX82771.1 3-hydroxyisobutyrate dehydrogenase [Streptomyces hiroshimensis]